MPIDYAALAKKNGGSAAPVQVDYAALAKAKGGQAGTQYKAPPFRYDVPVVEETREAKIARLQAEAEQAKKESDEANSPLGFAKNFGKAFIGTIAGGPIKVGEVLAAPYTVPQGSSQQMHDRRTQLVKIIREKEARGEDATRDKREFNSLSDLIEGEAKEIDKFNQELPSTLETVGALGETALDVLSAGTYGRGAATLKTGVLGTAAPRVTAPAATGLRGVLGRASTGAANALPTAPATIAAPGVARGIHTLPGLGRVAAGGAIGYAGDVTQGLQGKRGEDREGANAFIPGMGTVIGAGIPAALEAEQSVIQGANAIKTAFDPAEFVKKRTNAFQELFNTSVKLKNKYDKSIAKGYDVAEILASDDRYVPSGKNGGIVDGKVVPDAQIKAIQDDIDPLAKVVRSIIETEGRGHGIDDLKQRAIKEIDDIALEGAAYERVKANILADFDFYQNRYGVGENKSVLPLTVIDDIKKAKYGSINWNNPDSMAADRAIARAFRKSIESSVTDTDVRGLNRELGRLYDAQEMLEALKGKAVKGGSLGKYFARGFGLVVGAKGGPVGSLIGMGVADKLADMMQGNYFGNPLVKAAIGEIQKTQPALYEEAQKIVAQRAGDAATRLRLPPSTTIVPPAPVPKQGPMQVFTDYGEFRDAMGVPLPKAPQLALPPAGGSAIPIPARLPSSVDAAEAARRASGAIRNPAAGTGETVAKAIGRHLTEAQEVVQMLPPENFAANGGMPALIARTKENIVSGIRAEGFADVAEAIARLDVSAFQTLDDFANAVGRLIPR